MKARWTGMALFFFVASQMACENNAGTPPDNTVSSPSPVAARARLVEVRGKVSIKREAGDDWKEATSGLELFAGDKLRTERGARGTLQFADGSSVVLDEDSLIGLSESRTPQRALAQPPSSELTVLRGRINAELDDGAKQSLTVSTPSAEVRAGRELVFQ